MTNALARLGADKYSDFDFDLDHFSLDSNVFAEYFEGSSQVIVKGRLKANISFWQVLVPLSRFQILTNNRSALRDSDFVESAIQVLLSVGSIVTCSCPPDVVNPLSVCVQSSGKKSLTLDLRHV